MKTFLTIVFMYLANNANRFKADSNTLYLPYVLSR